MTELPGPDDCRYCGASLMPLRDHDCDAGPHASAVIDALWKLVDGPSPTLVVHATAAKVEVRTVADDKLLLAPGETADGQLIFAGPWGVSQPRIDHPVIQAQRRIGYELGRQAAWSAWNVARAELGDDLEVVELQGRAAERADVLAQLADAAEHEPNAERRAALRWAHAVVERGMHEGFAAKKRGEG